MKVDEMGKYCNSCIKALEKVDESVFESENTEIIVTNDKKITDFIVKGLGCPASPTKIAIHHEFSGHCAWEPEFCHITALLEDGKIIYYGTTYEEGDQWNFDHVYKASWDDHFDYVGYTADVDTYSIEEFKKVVAVLKLLMKCLSENFES